MTREVEAIYENGVFKPLEPQPFKENERVTLTVSTLGKAATAEWNPRTAEMKWIGENAHSYKGEYVALEGSELISHGVDGHRVIAEARSKGVQHPLIYHVPDHLGEPSIEWF